MATIELTLTDLLLSINLLLGIGLFVLLLSRKSELFSITRNYTLEPSVARAKNISPDEFLLFSFPDMNEHEIEKVRNDIEASGMINTIVTNREPNDVVSGPLNVEADEIVNKKGDDYEKRES